MKTIPYASVSLYFTLRAVAQSLTSTAIGCRKGNRECVYPDMQSSQKSSRTGTKSGKSNAGEGASSPEDQDEDEDRERLPPIMDDYEDDYDYDESLMSGSQDMRDSSHTPGSTLDQSTSPSTEASSTVPPTARPSLSRKGSAQTGRQAPPMKSSTSKTLDVQFYLEYFRNHITIHHYSLKRDTNNFLKGEFLSHAMKFDPLKYAVAGYAAYFHTLSQPDGRMSTFLHFYNESVSKLRAAITKNKKQGLATFLTILQLASIEVRPDGPFVLVSTDQSRRKCLVTGSTSWVIRKLHSVCLLDFIHRKASHSRTSSSK